MTSLGENRKRHGYILGTKLTYFERKAGIIRFLDGDRTFESFFSPWMLNKYTWKLFKMIPPYNGFYRWTLNISRKFKV